MERKWLETVLEKIKQTETWDMLKEPNENGEIPSDEDTLYSFLMEQGVEDIIEVDEIKQWLAEELIDDFTNNVEDVIIDGIYDARRKIDTLLTSLYEELEEIV
jgi:hypothetical protein